MKQELQIFDLYNDVIIQKGKLQAEKILKQSDPDLYQVILLLKDKNRIYAALAIFAVMRIIDDHVDKRIFLGEGGTGEKPQNVLFYWKNLVEATYSGNPPVEPLALLFFKSIYLFRIPKMLWDNFFSSMEKDTLKSSIDRFSDFEKYSYGANCVPTIIFFLIILSERKHNFYELNNFDYQKHGFNIGMWAYIIHTLRDIKQDIKKNFLYLPTQDLLKFNLDYDDLIEFSKTEIINQNYTDFVEFYLAKADIYYNSSIKTIETYIKTIEEDRKNTIIMILASYKKYKTILHSAKGNMFHNIQDNSDEISIFKESPVEMLEIVQ